MKQKGVYCFWCDSWFWLVVSLTLISVGVSVYFLSSGWFIIFQNIFYAPIVIACLKYPKRGFMFSVGVAVLYLSLVWMFSHDAAVLLQAETRGIIFIVIAAIIAFLSSGMQTQAEKEAARLYQQTQSVLELTNEGIYGLDLSGNITFINPVAARLLGYEVDELLGRNSHATWHYKKANGTAYPSEECSVYKAFREGAVQRERGSFIRKDGSVIVAGFTSTPIKENGKVVGACVKFRDLTEFERLQKEVEVSNEMLKSLIRHSPIFVYIKEVAQMESRILMASEKFRGMSGLLGQEMVGKSMHDLFPAEFAAKVTADDWNVIAYGKVIRREEHFDGRIYSTIKYPILQDGRKLVAGYIIDITDNKILENALKESERLLRESQDIASLGTYTLEFATDAWSSSVVLDRLFGITPAYDHSTAGWLGLVHPDDREMMMKYFQNEVVGKKNAFDKEYRIIRPEDGEERWVHGLGRLEFDAQQQLLRMHGTIQDITEYKRAAEEQIKIQKLESLGILAGGIAHDFNNLLTGVMGYVSLLIPEGNPRKREVLGGEAINATQRAADLTGKLLAFAKGGVPVKSVKSVATIIREAAEFSLGKSSLSSCELDLPNGLWSADVDAVQISQAIQNLVINANQAMPAGGTIRICARNVDLPEESMIGLEAGAFLHISVEDEGIGIPKEIIGKIFDPYFTTKGNAGGGSGLGLAVVHTVIKNHKGAVSVESKPGKGTVFNILLPATRQKASELREAVTSDHGDVRGLKILIMDDEEMIQRLLQSMLEDRHRIEVSSHGQSALDKYSAAVRSGDPFDLVILDLTIPGGMGGIETLERLRKINPHVVAIVSSGYSDVIPDGFTGALAKPYTRKKVEEVIAKISKVD
jgi:PAS domain S-box-containing protein